MKDLITTDYRFIMTSMSFNDFHKGKEGEHNFNVRLELSNFNSYYSEKMDKVRFDIDLLMIGTVDRIHTGFILNASTQLIFILKPNIEKEEIENLINIKNEESINKLTQTARPIIIKEIEDLFNKTFYRGVKINALY